MNGYSSDTSNLEMLRRLTEQLGDVPELTMGLDDNGQFSDNGNGY